MENKGLRVKFFLERTETNAEGLCPVMGRIQINGIREPFSTRLKVQVALWDSKSGRLTGKSGHATSLNAALEDITTSIHKRYDELSEKKEVVTARQIKAAFQGMAFSQETLLKFYRHCNDNFRKRVEKDRAIATAEDYDSMLRHLTIYVQEKYNLSDIPFAALTYSFIEGYDFWMRITLKLKSSTIINRTRRLIYIIKQANSRGYIMSNPFADYKFVRDAAEQKYLAEEDLNKLISTSLLKPHLELTRDMFLFACFTGLSFVDVRNLTDKNLSVSDDGVWWIRTFRQKTKVKCRIPLLPIAVAFLEKYKDAIKGDKLLPVPSLDTLNKNIKTVASICGIERNLTYHVGRHTFASEITLSQGLSIETVSALLGHSNILSTQHYAKTTQNKLCVDMADLDAIIEGQYKFAI